MFKNSKAKQKQYPAETMDEIFSLILHGCKLAKDLESNLGNLANQPEMLFKSCDDIMKIFATAKEALSNAAQGQHHHGLVTDNLLSETQADPSLQEWLKYGVTQAMSMIQQQLVQQAGKTSSPSEINEMCRKNLLEGTSSASARMKGSLAEIQAMDVSDSGRGSGSSSSSSQRPRRRNDDKEKCIMTVPAPQMGNTDVPPEDNYTWRKYGQKEILGSKYPRAYYRCTHQKMYNCPAKKQVQRLDNDFYTFEVTYIGQHTCHMSSTAPSIPPPQSVPTTSLEIATVQDQMMFMSQAMVTQPSTTATASSSVLPGRSWLSMEFSLGSGPSGSVSGSAAGGSGGGGSGGGGGSTATGSRYGRDVVDYPAVADMADVMFNSGSSSSNSMDFIFPCGEDKLPEAGDKKN